MRLSKSELIVVESARLEAVELVKRWEAPAPSVIDYKGTKVRLPPVMTRQEFDGMQQDELDRLRALPLGVLACHNPYVAHLLQCWRCRREGVSV